MTAPSEQPVIDALYRISRIVASTEDPREALEGVIDAIMAVLPAESASIELLNPDKNRLQIEVQRGFPKAVQSTELRLGEGVTGWVALHGRPLNIGDVREDPRYVELDPAIRSELAVPMRTETGLVIGVVNIDSSRIGAFTAQHQKILTLLSGEATRSLSRLWLIRQLRHTADHLEVLIDIAQSIVTKRELGEILATITTRCGEIIRCRLSAIFLRDKDGKTLSLRAASGPDGPLDHRETIHLAESSIGTAYRRRKSIEITDLPRIEEHHFQQLIQREKLVSMLSCPIQYEQEVIGVLNIYTDYPHRFNDGEKRIFETLASLSAAAIRNAELYRRIFQSEETLRRSERLTTLGLLSAEIAHEIRNPLTVIQLLFESLALDFADDDPRQRDVHIIHEKLEQLESIVTRVLGFGKSQQEMHARYSLDKLIEDTLHLVRLKLRQSRIELVFTHDPKRPPQVDVNKGQIQQAVLNLLLNATQALPDGGRIEVSTTIEDADGGAAAVIRIRDNGPGIDPAIQESIFDSFLTGRPDGTGLGLSIVKRILKSHKGAIEVERSDAAGTVMRMSLPLARAPA
jgi:signal transduction histidine kinase